MSRSLALCLAAALSIAAGCVTINVYFPAAAAEKAADRIIDDVWGQAPQKARPATPAPSSGLSAARLLIGALEWLVPAAQAQEPNIDLSSPEIARLTAQMENRMADLRPLLESGAVGLTADGDVAARDPSLVPLAQRNSVRTVVGNENADRAALYREIARANGHPEWEGQIRSVFAQRWIAKAQPGWWYQDANGAWKKK